VTVAHAQTADTTAVLYALADPPSAFEVGCFGRCACPISSWPLSGTFVLSDAGVDPLYHNYDVTRIDWSFGTAGSVTRITGTGRYRIGGEFALEQQLTLDLVIDGRASQHFDSGLQPGGSGFPHLQEECAVHGLACFDSVVHLDAKPTGTAGVPPLVTGITRVVPNPSRDPVELQLETSRAGPVRVDVLDLEGREVRRLLVAAWLDAGPHVLGWDGTLAHGKRAPPGIYLVRLRAPGAIRWARVARLR
jgi:hypothetical protein